MQRKSTVDPQAEKDRKDARKRAERENARAAMMQSQSMTSDFDRAYGRPNLFAAGTAITKMR